MKKSFMVFAIILANFLVASVLAQNIINPKISNITQRSALVSFNTDTPGNTIVYYKNLDRKEAFEFKNDFQSVNHQVLLDGLFENANYEVSLESWLADHSIAKFGPMLFHTLAVGGLEISLSPYTAPMQNVSPGQQNVEGLTVSFLARGSDNLSLERVIIGAGIPLENYIINVRLVDAASNNVISEVTRFNANVVDFFIQPNEVLLYPTIARDLKIIFDVAKTAPSGLLFNLGVRGASDIYARGGSGTVIATGSAWGNLIMVATQTKIASSAPKEFALTQNYPNPFNSTTVIKFSLPQREKVSLKIYDVLGREIKTMVNEIRDAGEYQEILDARALSSGTYFYILEAGAFKMNRKMTNYLK